MLTEDRRKQLDDIVGKMTSNRETDDAINFVVNDFKNKYSVEEPQKSFSEKTADVLDMFFGGGKVGEAIGTEIAKGTFGKTIQKAVIGKELTPQEESFVSQSPSAGQIAGSALQSASLFAPVGTIAKGITGGARAIGMVKGASALGKIGAGALSGELFDVASNLQQGKTGSEALTPGIGALLGGAIPAVGVMKNVAVRFGEKQAPRVINSLIKPLAKDFSYGKNPGRAVAEEGIVANNFDDLITGIRNSKQKVGQQIGELGDQLSTRPVIDITDSLAPIDEAIKASASQNNQALVTRLNNIKRAVTEVLEPSFDDAGNLTIKSVGSRDLNNLTFKQVRDRLGDIGDLTAFTGNPSDDKLVNSALKQVYGKIKGKSINYAREINPELANNFEKLTEKYADLSSAEIATKYRDKIVERQALIGLSPQNVGIGTGLITAVATGGATIPAVLAGISAGVIDKLAQTPAFKTRLAYILSKKTQGEVNYLLKKIPALKSFFSTKKGLTPGDVVLGKAKEELQKIESIPNKSGGFIKTGVSQADDLLQEAKKYKSAEEFVNAKTTRDGYGDDFLVHATNDEIKNGVMKFGGGDNTKKGGQSGGLFFTNKEQFADVFGKNKYYADKSLKNKVLDLSSTFEWNKIKNQIGKKYKTYEGDLATFTKQDYDMIFPNGKNPDFATIAQYGDFFEDVVPKLGYDGIAFPEYAGGVTGKTYQFYKDNIPVYTKSQLTDIWNKANKK